MNFRNFCLCTLLSICSVIAITNTATAETTTVETGTTDICARSRGLVEHIEAFFGKHCSDVSIGDLAQIGQIPTNGETPELILAEIASGDFDGFSNLKSIRIWTSKIAPDAFRGMNVSGSIEIRGNFPELPKGAIANVTANSLVIVGFMMSRLEPGVFDGSNFDRINFRDGGRQKEWVLETGVFKNVKFRSLNFHEFGLISIATGAIDGVICDSIEIASFNKNMHIDTSAFRNIRAKEFLISSFFDVLSSDEVFENSKIERFTIDSDLVSIGSFALKGLMTDIIDLTGNRIYYLAPNALAGILPFYPETKVRVDLSNNPIPEDRKAQLIREYPELRLNID